MHLFYKDSKFKKKLRGGGGGGGGEGGGVRGARVIFLNKNPTL